MLGLLYRSRYVPALLMTVLGFIVMGYHPGAEDDGVYLAAVKSAASPALYPHDANFFKFQMRTSVFDTWMAHFVQLTGMSIGWAEMLFQFISLFLMMCACWTILSILFDEASARWGGLAMFAAMLTLPVSGTALYIADQYLHPRNPATALILFAAARIMVGRRWHAVPLLLLAFILHPLMGAFGISFCFVLSLFLSEPVRARIREFAPRMDSSADPAIPAAGFIPFGWVFEKPSQSFLDAVRTRHCYHLFEWTWYEWLGAIGPLVIFWFVLQSARRNGQTALARFTLAVLVYGVFHQLVALILLGPTGLEGLTTLEPMRFLQLIYVFLTLLGGAYLGKYVLQAKAWRWAAFLVVAGGGMMFAQRQLFASTEHIEWPGQSSKNPWLQAFDWARENTPTDAYFALDPNYMSAPEEDNHGFRALADRSVLADAVKDTAVITKAPELGPVWAKQVQATKGWEHFRLADYQRLQQEFGVNWVIVSYPAPLGLTCRWHNAQLSVCQIPSTLDGASAMKAIPRRSTQTTVEARAASTQQTGIHVE